MTSLISQIPLWVDIGALAISIPVVLGGLVEAATPFQIRIRKRKVGIKHRVGSLSLVGAFLVVAVGAASGIHVSNEPPQARTHLTFIEPQRPPDGAPALVSCHTAVIVQGSIPKGDRPALATEQAGTAVFYFESAMTPGPQQDEWSGSVTLGNTSSNGDQFTLYVVAVPEDWESYIVQAVNWKHPRNTDWAQSRLPPGTSIATTIVVQQRNVNC